MTLDAKTLEFEPESHTYTLDGTVVPSVSQIIQAAGYWGDTSFFKPGAAEKGTRIHKAIELLNLDQLDRSQIEGTGYVPYVDAYELWRKEFQPEILDVEVRLVGECEGVVYAGTVDLIATVKDDLCVIDLKTGRQHPKPYRAQLGAYALAYEIATDRSAGQLIGLHINDKGRYQLKKYKKDEAFDSFAQACRRYKEEGVTHAA